MSMTTPENTTKKSRDFLIAALLGVLAAFVYGVTCSRGVFPGESAMLIAYFTGLENLPFPQHPLWGAIVSWTSHFSFLTLPLRLNLLSVIFSTCSVMMLYFIMSHLIRRAITEEYSIDYAVPVSRLGGAVAAIALLFSVPVWHAATRLQYQSFDLFYVLCAVCLLLLYTFTSWRSLLALFAFLCGFGVVETASFIPILPILVAFSVYIIWRHGSLSLQRITWMFAIFVVGISFYYFISKQFIQNYPNPELNELKTPMAVMIAIWRHQVGYLLTNLPRVGWIILLIMSVVPWFAMVFAAQRALNNERSWSQYILHITLTIITVLGLTNTGISPSEILKPYGQLPIFAYTMLAMLGGYLVAYWYLLFKVRRPRKGLVVSPLTMSSGEWMGLLLTYPLIVVIVIASLLNTFQCKRSRGDFADRCAKEILDRMGTRTWFITDGTLDNHLKILARERKQELNLLCLQKDMSQSYLKELEKLIVAKKLFDEATQARMISTIDLGVLPFIQDWFAFDKDIEKKVAVYNVPDFWYTAGLTPISEFFFFSGIRDIQPLKGKSLYTDYVAFWKAMESDLAISKREADSTEPMVLLKKELRRHMGFVANNLGVTLEDLGQEKDAFSTYTYVNKIIDKENVSALFNRFEMARRNAACTVASKAAIERELKDFIANLKRQYPLWSLSRYYGYVRSPEIFARLGWGWALSGQTGAALAGINRAIELLPLEQRNNALQTMAAIYNLSEDRAKTEAVYKDIIKSDPSNRTALLGLARLAVQEGALEKARAWLEKASKSDDKKGALGVEWASIYLMNNDLARARMALQETTDLQPKNLQAWAMLAMLQLQQDEVNDVEKVTLPRMENIAGTVDNYFIQITRAQLAVKKGKNYNRAARENFIRASILRPEIAALKDMILQLDIAMNDQESAQLHARQVLRVNRKHALANYVMGSLRLQQGDYGEAEDFLRRSVDTNPSAAALNDLAEVLRRIKRYDDAEKFARLSIEKNKELYVAWETLGSILFEANKDLNEAEACVKKAMTIYSDDLRIKITLARIQLKKGDIEIARETIRQLRLHQSELPKFDAGELDKLDAQASAFKRSK